MNSPQRRRHLPHRPARRQMSTMRKRPTRARRLVSCRCPFSPKPGKLPFRGCFPCLCTVVRGSHPGFDIVVWSLRPPLVGRLRDDQEVSRRMTRSATGHANVTPARRQAARSNPSSASALAGVSILAGGVSRSSHAVGWRGSASLVRGYDESKDQCQVAGVRPGLCSGIP